MENANNKKNIFITKNAVFGLFIGIGDMLATYVFYKAGKDITLNRQLADAIMLLTVAGIFIGVRKYREETLNGVMTYGKALSAATFMTSVAASLYGIFIYALYKLIPELQEYYITSLNRLLEDAYKDSPLPNDMKAFMGSLITPGAIAFSEAFNKFFMGFLFSLPIAGILRRKRNKADTLSHF